MLLAIVLVVWTSGAVSVVIRTGALLTAICVCAAGADWSRSHSSQDLHDLTALKTADVTGSWRSTAGHEITLGADGRFAVAGRPARAQSSVPARWSGTWTLTSDSSGSLVDLTGDDGSGSVVPGTEHVLVFEYGSGRVLCWAASAKDFCTETYYPKR